MTTNIKIKKFRLTDEAVAVVKVNKKLREDVIATLKTSENGLRRYLRNNEKYSYTPLTNPTIISLIVDSTSLNQDQIIESIEA